MGLTSATEIKLTNASFTKGYADRKKIWLAMAREAFAFTKGTIGGEPKRDDVAPHLALALEVRPEFLKLRDERGVSAKYWYRDFADYIIDKAWPTLVAP